MNNIDKKPKLTLKPQFRKKKLDIKDKNLTMRYENTKYRKEQEEQRLKEQNKILRQQLHEQEEKRKKDLEDIRQTIELMKMGINPFYSYNDYKMYLTDSDFSSDSD